MRRLRLDEGWTLRAIPPALPYLRPQGGRLPAVPARVPGNVHLDLVEAGIIADPFLRRHEWGCQWVDEMDWEYTRIITWNGGSSRQVIRFEGIDTVADVFLNDQFLGHADNHFLPHEFDVTQLLRPGENILSVRIASPVRTGMARREMWVAEHGLAPDTVFFDERSFVRKPAYASGWDWGPRLVGAGLFAPVWLLDFDERITQFDVSVEPAGDLVFFVRVAGGASHYDLQLGPGATSERSQEGWLVRCDPEAIWWPLGMGAQPLHRVVARLERDGQVVDEQVKTIGFRTLQLIREADEIGESFEFLVNGQRFLARGANWIPNDSFLSRVRDDDVAAQMATAARLGMNMMRVWGGGQYETEAFYDACDRLGILVWQDFPYACSYYPDDENFMEVARQEAAHHVLRLRHRTSLALWCGNNENLIMWQTRWGSDQGTQPPRYLGEPIYDEVLPRVVGDLDPLRAYIASSPIGQGPDDPHVNVGRYGDSHYWEVWHGRGDWIHYRDSDTRFSSEFGFASAATPETYQTCLTTDERTDFPSAAFLSHDKTGKPWEMFVGYVERHYPPSQTLDDWIYYSHLNQRDALRFAIEHYRSVAPCRGTLIWQFNDCWPVQSWAVQDYARILKPAGFELARLHADVLVAAPFAVGDPDLIAFLVNDGPSPVSGELCLDVYDPASGRCLHSQVWFAEAVPGERVEVARLPTEGLGGIARIGFPGVADRWVPLVEPRDLALSQPNLVARREGDELIIESDQFVVDLVVWDPDNPGAIRSLAIDEPGWHPVTGPAGEYRYRLGSQTKSIVARSLAGQVKLA